MEASPRYPGWYPDPMDPVQLRHWNGGGWDEQRRTAPAWAVGTKDYVLVEADRRAGAPMLDGPVHAAGLPAIAAAAAQSSRARHRLAGLGQLGGSSGSTGARVAVARGSLGARPLGRTSWSRRRLALLTAAALIGLVALVLAATFGVAPQPFDTPTLAQDTAFATSANIACGEAMGAIRLLPIPTISPAGASTTAAPVVVEAANRNLTLLAAKIRALPAIDAAHGSITGWLDDWSRFGADRQRQAVEAHQESEAGRRAAVSMASTVSLDADAADAFATTHGLASCVLGTGTSPVPGS